MTLSVWFTVQFPAKRWLTHKCSIVFVEFVVVEFLKVPAKSQDLTWVTCPFLNQFFDQGGVQGSTILGLYHMIKKRNESPTKPWALTVEEDGSPKEIWGIKKEKQMLGRQNNKYAYQWTIRKVMLELNFKG